MRTRMGASKTPGESAMSELERIQQLCRHIERQILGGSGDQPLSLAALGKLVGMSPFHLQRRFKAVAGVSPKEYAEAVRLKSLKAGLRKTGRVTDAIYEAGFGSGSRVYEKIDTRLGMTPKQYRDGAAGVTISFASADTALGRMMIGATDRGVCFLQFADDDDALSRMLSREYPNATVEPMADAQRNAFDAYMTALARYLDGGTPNLALPLDLRGTAFQMKVWKALLDIPRGAVMSYSEVASAIGSPKAVRAVASACGANRVALAVPCHRVIRGDGALGGYKWGLERKRAVLDRERASRSE
jgi:AraC family transcriptional regulator, regulatory protein of adaptative response / methylated-DNA-[protein]-cysteine methyltransferase